MSIKEIRFLSSWSFAVLHKPWLLFLITFVCPWLHFLAAQFGVECSAQEWAILVPWKSPDKQLSVVAPFVPFRIHSESLAVKKKKKEKSHILLNIVLSHCVSCFWLVFSSGFRLTFPACWSAHDLKSLVRNSAALPCSWLLSLNSFSWHLQRAGEQPEQEQFPANAHFCHTWQQNTFCWIYSFLSLCLGLVESCEWMLKACFVLHW